MTATTITILILGTFAILGTDASATQSLLKIGSRSQRITAEMKAGIRSASGLKAVAVGQPSSTARMHHMMDMLQKFKNSAEQNRQGVDLRHQNEEQRLQAAMLQTGDGAVRAALNASLTSSDLSVLETRKVYDNMVSFSDALSGLLTAANSKGSACESTTCGTHASCTDTMEGAQCVCDEGFLGDGTICTPPAEYKPQRLLFEGTAGVATRAGDFDVTVFESNKIAIVFNDASKGTIGRIVLGSVREAGQVDLSPPEQFTLPGGKAYSPVVQGSQGKRIMVAWRDQNRGGTGYVRGATLGTTGIRGANMALTWGQPVSIAINQAHKMSLVSLTGNRFGVLYSDKVLATSHTAQESFGNSVFAEVGPAGEVQKFGHYRFSDVAVCRLEVTKVSPTAFVLAARGAKNVDDMDASISTNQEAMAVYGEAVGDDLIFSPNPVNLEPEGTQIWARGLSLIAPNTFAYSYQAGKDQAIKMAVVEFDPATHKMEVVQRPQTITSGFSPYVSMLSVPYTPADPHTLTLYAGTNSSKVNICSYSASKKAISKCQDYSWHAQSLSSVSGCHLGGGKALMVFATESGSPYYTVFGLSKK